jgi:hypothetical protein
MKTIIIALTFLLFASFFALEVAKVQAEPISIYSITFEDLNGNVVSRARYVEGANLRDFELPTAPNLEGFIFIGWSEVLPNEMPGHSIILEAVYISATSIVFQTKLG